MVIAVGRVMTCVLGMIVRRQREIRSFQKTPFYRVLANVSFLEQTFEAEWRAVEGSRYYQTPLLYGEKGNGFVKKETARELINFIAGTAAYGKCFEGGKKDGKESSSNALQSGRTAK